ncbi:MAG: glycosyltransferase [Pseudomonadales bacterium]|nr:glycosyltransferase [Pseudomonadales bacterium]MCP5188062.1 glycosyltransferase [Pseudomonadales bacterium]
MNRNTEKRPAVFVATDSAMESTSGGIQIFTREYQLILQMAGFHLNNILFSPSNGLREKIMRRIDRNPYRYFIPEYLANQVLSFCQSKEVSTVFLNGEDLAPLSEVLKKKQPDLQVILLSYGLESADYLHEIRTRSWRSDFSRVRSSHVSRLGRLLVEESKHRRSVDAVLCMSDFEAEIENWIGAKKVLVVPRLISLIPFEWDPMLGRVGFVGRLDHPPNLEGLRLVLEELKGRCPVDFKLRIVGAPSRFGASLSRQFPFVEYLGVLSEQDLHLEAKTWSCSMNPVFCYARGASTKLAVLLGWGLPVITTLEGMRGYEWGADIPIVADSPKEFAKALLSLAFDARKRNEAKAGVRRICESSVTADRIAKRISEFLLSLPHNHTESY